MDKFQNKYRIPSARLQSWDYTWAAFYFITICTKDRIHYFGEIHNGTMQLSNVGIIANIMWYEIKYHAKNIDLGEFVVMPNHIHGILILKNDELSVSDSNVSDINVSNSNVSNSNVSDINVSNSNVSDINVSDINVETRHALSLQSNNQSNNKSNDSIGKQRFQNQGKNSVSSIIGAYKSAVTKHCNRLGLDFEWQTRFHDHIIRDDKSFTNISAYISNNPKNWKEDKFY